MKQSLILVLLFICSKLLLCQTTTYHSNDTLDQVIRHGSFYNGVYYFLTSSGVVIDFGHPLLFETLGYKSSIVKFNSDLIPVDSVIIDSIGGYICNAIKIQLDNDSVFIVGRAIRPDASDEQIFISCYNSDLELAWTSIIGEENRMEVMSDFIINQEGNLVIPGKVYMDNWEDSYFILYECSRRGQVLQYKQDTSWNTGGGRVVQLSDTKGYHISNLYNLSIYDSSLNHIVTQVPEFYQTFINGSYMVNKGSNKYLTAGVKILVNKSYGDIPRTDYDLLVSWYLVDDQAIGLDYGYIDLTGYSCKEGGVDYLEPDVLCYGGTQNSNFYNGSFTPIDTWVIAKSINFTEQTENWFFRFGGDACYLMRGLFLTPQNECIIYSTIYDWHNTSRLERDILIMKIDSTGTLVDVNNTVDQTTDFTVYPNPGTNAISIRSQQCNATFKLISLDGRVHLSEKIQQNNQVYNTDYLKAGIYIYTIVDDHKRILSKGKWIKK